MGKTNREEAREAMSRNLALDKKKLLVKLRTTPIVEVACKQTGVPRSTYYRWRKDDEDFANECDEAIEHSAGLINDMAESQLISAIKDKNMSAIFFWLKHHHKSYKTRIEVDAKLQTIQQELTSEQTEVVARALRLAGLTIEDETNEVS
jgi:predicted ArsR family transcriptional regulator